MRILVSVAEGLGNVLQTLPLIWSLQKAGHEITIWLQCNFPNVDIILNILTDCQVSLMGNPLPYPQDWYDGRIETIWSATNMSRISALEKQKIPILNNLNKQQFETRIYQEQEFTKVKYLKTEVQVALDIFGELEPNKEIIYKTKNIKQKILDFCISRIDSNERILYKKCLLNNLILLHNGYNFNSRKLWKRKTYDNWDNIITELYEMDPKIQIGSIGASHEYIERTKNFTEISVYCIIALMLESKIFISNDTGTYHLAAALGILGIVIFTFTNIDKNYDSNFHNNITVIQSLLPCCPCQSTNYRDKCTNFKCKDIPSFAIIDAIIDLIKKENGRKK